MRPVLLFLFVACVGWSATLNAEDVNQAAFNLLKAGQYDQVIALAERHIEKGIDRADWLRRKAYALALRGDLEKALLFSGEAYKENDEQVNRDVYVWLLLSCQKLKEFEALCDEVYRSSFAPSWIVIYGCILLGPESRQHYARMTERISVRDLLNDPQLADAVAFWERTYERNPRFLGSSADDGVASKDDPLLVERYAIVHAGYRIVCKSRIYISAEEVITIQADIEVQKENPPAGKAPQTFKIRSG